MNNVDETSSAIGTRNGFAEPITETFHRGAVDGSALTPTARLNGCDDSTRALRLLTGEKQVLELLARGQPLDPILDAICRLIEELAPGTMASVWLLDEGGRPRAHAAPSQPPSYIEAINASTGDPLGTMAIYRRDPWPASAIPLDLVERLAPLAALVVERCRADAALKESEERFRRMAETTSDVIWITDLEPEKVVYVGPSFERVFGISCAELYQDPQLWLSGIHPDDRSRVADSFAQWIQGAADQPWEAEFRAVHRDGTVRWMHDRGACSSVAGRQRVSGILTDITARRLAENALAESEGRFALVVAGLTDGVWDWDITSDWMYMSEQAQRLCGVEPGPTSWPRSEWLALTRRKPSEENERWDRMVVDYLAGRIPAFDGEWSVLHDDGITRWVRVSGVCVRDASGRATRLAGSVTDIDDRKRTEQALQKSEQRHSLAMEAARDGHWDWIAETDEFYASPRMLEIYGFPADTRFNGRQDFLDRFPFHPDDRSRWEAAASKHFSQGGSRFEIDLRMMRHGELRWIKTNGLLSCDADGRPTRYTGSVSDITERKAAEAALRESEQRFALATEGSSDGIYDWDLNTNQMFLSHRCQQLYGLEPGEPIRPRPVWDAMVTIHPEDIDRQRRIKRDYLEGRISSYDDEWRVLHPDGSYRWIRLRGACIRDHMQRATRLAGSVSDIDARRRAEAAMQQMQRMEAVGTLAGGVAHDFNNILAVILGFGEAALKNTRSGSRMRRDLERIQSAGERGRALVERILAFSRSSVGARIVVNVEKVVAESLTMVEAMCPRNVRLDARLRSGNATILADPTQVHQLVMNLATNGMQAMQAGGTLQIELSCEGLVAESMMTTGPLPPGEYILLCVRDNGTGIDPSIREKIFDPFFTTKDVGTGTGLGLSLVHGIVTELGGAIDVATEVDMGTSFTAYLPRGGDPSEQTAEASAPLARGHNESILLVDDEEDLVRLYSDVLTELGYRPMAFTSADKALKAFCLDPGSFDAVITDLRMPHMSGLHLIQKLREVQGEIPILLASGFLPGAAANETREAGASFILHKPISRRDLALTLSEALRGRPHDRQATTDEEPLP